MPRVSKRKKNTDIKPTQKYYRTYLYVRLSEKDGGHGRKDSIHIQKQICTDFLKLHPELLCIKTYSDNGVTGTTFERPEFDLLMNDVREGKVDCIIVKDFSRFGRDALDAVDLIDSIFPRLGIRFISVLDDYDSENPACADNRVSNILKHFMNDYYARESSVKLVQAHELSSSKGEFWGARPPYGYRRSKESSKKLVPEESEKEIVQKIFYWYVFENLSSYEIAKELNSSNILSPQQSYEIREYGKCKRNKKIYWGADRIRHMLQNPLYIGAAVNGKTKQMLYNNIPLQLIPRDEWNIKEGVWEPLVERTVFEQAQEIAKIRWKETLERWAVNVNEEQAANGPLIGKVFCAHCERKLFRKRCKGVKSFFEYECPTLRNTVDVCKLQRIKESYIFEAISAALKYQIRLAVDFSKKYGTDFYQKLETEFQHNIIIARQDYEKYEKKLEQLFEHYATGILSKEDYLEIKETFLAEQDNAHTGMEKVQIHSQNVLERLKAKMDWAHGLLTYQDFSKIDKTIVERFIQKIIVLSSEEIEVEFWFGDIFDEEIVSVEGGLPYAV